MDLDEISIGFAKGDTTLVKPSDAHSISSALKAVEGWYARLGRKSRWMDLIGDYAGSEKFVIDGDALIAFVLDDPLLALGRVNDPSFQIAHSKWLLEKVLKNFLDRSAVFDVVFWEDSRHLTIRTGSNDYTCISRELARHILFEHLRILNIPVHVFIGLSDSRWSSYCSLTRPMFIMTTDGRKGGSNHNSDFFAGCLLRQLLFIHDIVAEGIAVSLLDAIEFRDARITSFILEEQRQLERKPTFPQTAYSYRSIALESMDAIMQCRRLRVTPRIISENEPAEALLLFLRDFVRGFASHINVTMEPLTLWVLRTFLVHFFVLNHITLAQRAQDLPALNTELMDIVVQTFLPSALDVLADVVSDQHWLLDIDTRIFVCILHVQTSRVKLSLEEIVGRDIVMSTDSLLKEYSTLRKSSEAVASRFAISTPDSPDLAPMCSDESTITVLPFHNDVLAAELSVVHVKVEDENISTSRPGFFNYGDCALFVDDKHWHHSRPILPKHMGGEGVGPQLEYARKKALKRDQRFMANMQKHAETLTGAIGAPLEQQVIISTTRSSRTREKEVVPRPIHQGNKPLKPKALTKTERMKRDIIAAKQATAEEESTSWWQKQIADFKRLSDVALKSARAKALLINDRVRKSSWLYQELQLFIIDIELKEWILHEGKETAAVRDEFSVSVIFKAKALYEQEDLSSGIRESLERIFRALGFGDYFASLKPSEPNFDKNSRALSFDPTKLLRSTGSHVYDFMCITEHPVEWQLRLFGEHMDRSMDSQPDKRVSFKPDAWQREVLNCLDDNQSVLVVAPTSAGKTFISFYAMEKVLRESDDGILVYIAPTKALVNQVAAEVYARFKKETRSGTVWSIQTRDYRIHDPQKCQILITVPEMFSIMLLSPPLARTWIPRIKRIILDEIHTIGQQDGGAVWEQILLLAPCPIIGLSATIGQPESFNKWLASVQKAHGFQHKLILHPHRYSHLRKFIYVAPQTPTIFTGLEDSKEAEKQLRFIHPVSALAFGNPNMPPDFSLEARDTLSLYRALERVQSELPQLIDLSELHPTRFFKNRFLTQKDVLEYEAQLKECLMSLISLPDSSNERSTLHRVISIINEPALQSIPGENLNVPPSPHEFLDGLMGLLTALNSTGSLPALLFSFDRSNCEAMAKVIIKKLIESETNWKSQSKEWARKVHQWELHQLRKQERRRANEKSKSKRLNNEDARDQQDIESSQQSTFDPNDPVPQFSFAGWRKYSKGELDVDIGELAWTTTPKWAKDALRRGVGVHHAGMNKVYRSLVESLFRIGFIRILFCTGTLALGINAPTKTSVFCGDSPYLTALNYRQCAGRAGRRGFDLLGKIVFYGIPMDRIQRLLLSKIPSLGANFPLTSTLSLRLLNLLHGSETPVSTKSKDTSSNFAATAIKSILSLPQISFGSESGKEQLLHHFRFSIEYLRRAQLIDVLGRPMNLYAIAAHLYHTEPSNFALISLISSGVLHKVCSDSNAERARRNTMLLMCHLFGRRYLHHAYASGDNLARVRKVYPSLVVLPPLSEDARHTLEKHNLEILQIFSSYAKLYATQYEAFLGPDDLLPLSHVMLSGRDRELELSTVLSSFLDSKKIAVHSRSSFVANSGHHDAVNSIEELTRTSRKGLQLNEFAIPSLSQIISTSKLDTASGAKDSRKLNAYIYDFFMHGQVDTLVVANGIRRGDVWYALEDFNLTLSTIRAAFQQLMRTVSKTATNDDNETPQLTPDFDTVDGDMEDDSGYATGSIAGRSESPATDKAEGLKFQRPPGILDMDWRVYEIVDGLANEFYEKFKKMWA